MNASCGNEACPNKSVVSEFQYEWKSDDEYLDRDPKIGADRSVMRLSSIKPVGLG
jgi:hypothetical protein